MALSIISLSKHQYYYEPRGRRPGRKQTPTTLKKDGDQIVEVDNQIITNQIKTAQEDPDTGYGYRKM